MPRPVSVILGLDALLALAWGSALFLAPEKQRETDGVHWHLLRCIGGQVLSSVLFFRFRNRQPETRTSCYLVRVLAWALTVFLTYHSQSFVRAIVYIGIFSIVFYFISLVVSGWPLGDILYKEKWFGNFLYQLDALASISIGTAWIACPHWLLHRQVKITMDESHELCGRFMGLLFVSSYVLSTHALHWKDLRDRSLAAEARAVCCFFILTAQIWSQYAYEKDWSGSHWVGIMLFSIWTVVSFTYSIYLYFTLPVKSKKQ